MGQIAQALDPADGGALAAVHDQQGPRLAFDHQAQVAGAAQVFGQRRAGDQQGGQEWLEHHCVSVVRR